MIWPRRRISRSGRRPGSCFSQGSTVRTAVPADLAVGSAPLTISSSAGVDKLRVLSGCPPMRRVHGCGEHDVMARPQWPCMPDDHAPEDRQADGPGDPGARRGGEVQASHDNLPVAMRARPRQSRARTQQPDRRH